MSKSSDTVVQRDMDESLLFDDGYSIVDDINAGTGTMDESTGEKGFTKENGKKCRNQSADEDINSMEVVSDTKVKNEEATEKKEEAKGLIEKERENAKNSSKKQDPTKTENTIVKKEKIIELESSHTKNSDLNESTLIISNDDDLGTDIPALDKSLSKRGNHINEVKNEKGGEIVPTNTNRCVDTSVMKTIRKKKPTDGSFVWISNISKLVKASSLKKHFAECGKVNTAKVVTNGKVFFGYVEFESSEHALNCVKTLNNSILGGKNIIVSRNRPDVNKKTVPAKKNLVINAIVAPKSEEMKNQFVGMEQPEKFSASESKTTNDNKRKSEDNSKDENRKKVKSNDEKVQIKKKHEADEKKQGDEKQKNDYKKPRSIKLGHAPSKNDVDLRYKLNESKKKIDLLKQDLTRTQIEVSNLRRRLRNEQKKSKAEEMSNQKYRQEVRTLSDQLKQTRSEFDKEMHRVVKKHKIEMEKAEYYRDNFLKHKDELKRRQEELDREFRKLEQAKQSLEHIKRSRKSRSLSPAIKRFRSRDGTFHDHRSPPPPPKLTSEVRPKTPLERPSTYYEEKKPRTIYERLGDYSDKSFSKETNGRERSSYPSDVVGVQKSSWSHSAAEPWKKTSTTATFLKPYMERFGTSHQEFQAPPSSYYSQGTLDYSKHNHFDIARKY